MSSSTSPKVIQVTRIIRPVIRDQIVPSKADIDSPIPEENELYFETNDQPPPKNRSQRRSIVSSRVVSESLVPSKQDIEAPITPENCLYEKNSERRASLRKRLIEEDQTQRFPETPNRLSDGVRTCRTIESPIKSEATQSSADKETFHTPMLSPLVEPTPKSQKSGEKKRKTPEHVEVNVSMSKEVTESIPQTSKEINTLPKVLLNGNAENGDESILQKSSRTMTELRFYIFIALLVLLIAYSIALWNRESVCNAIRTDENDYFVYNDE